MNNPQITQGCRFTMKKPLILLAVSLSAWTLADAQVGSLGQGSAAPGAGGARPDESGFVVALTSNDTDKNGTLSQEEAANVRLLSPSLFKAVDQNGDGRISPDEAIRADKIEAYKGDPVRIDFEGKTWIADHAIGAEVLEYKGKQAMHIVGREKCLVYLPVDDFSNGTVEADIAGDIFSGIVFRVRENGQRAEKVYFRPQNAHTERHQNTVQYAVIGREDGHWSSLRKNFPGKYENGADIRQGEWFHVRLVVRDKSVKVFVNDGPDPVLEVDPMLDGITAGSIGLWGWDSYFANFKFTRQ